MSNNVDQQDQEDVVVIEQRDKNTLIYIAVAAVLGVALGGLVGSVLTKTKWEVAYNHLETKLENTKQTHKEVIVEKIVSVEKKTAEIESEIEKRVADQIAKMTEQNVAEFEKTQSMVTELEKVNLELDNRIQAHTKEIAEQKETIAQLNQQVDLQVNVYDRSRELFQRELLIKQDLEKLLDERETLGPRLKRFQKECDIYLDGTSFDVNASACDTRDEINSNISQIDQMVEVHKLDLREIDSIKSRIGL